MGPPNQYIAGLIAALGAFCLGSVIGWTGPVKMDIMAGSAYGFSPSTVEWGLVGSLMTLGGALACIPVGILIGKIGRKVTMLFPVLQEAIGPTYVFGIFFIIAVLAFLFIIFLIPEMKGKTLSEIQAKIGGKKEKEKEPSLKDHY